MGDGGSSAERKARVAIIEASFSHPAPLPLSFLSHLARSTYMCIYIHTSLYRSPSPFIVLRESVHVKPRKRVAKSRRWWCARRSACRWMDALSGAPSTISVLREASQGLRSALHRPSRISKRVKGSPSRAHHHPARARVTYTSAVHARPRPTGEIIFRVIFRAQTKLEWMQNARK